MNLYTMAIQKHMFILECILSNSIEHIVKSVF